MTTESIPGQEPPRDPGSPGVSRDAIRHSLTAVIVLAAVGVAVGLLLIQRIGRTYQDALAAAEGAASAAATGSSSVATLAEDVAVLADTTGSGIDEGLVVLGTAAAATEDLGTAAGTNLAGSIEGTAALANRVAGAFETIERFIPGNRESAAEDLREIADGLEPVPDQLRDLGEQLTSGADELRTAGDALAPLSDQLAVTAAHIREASGSLAEVEQVASDVEARAAAASDRVKADMWLARIALIVLGAGIAIAAYAARRTLD